MIPNKYILTFRSADKGKLIPSSVITEEQQRVERHVEVFKLLVTAERDIFGENPLSRPDHLGSILSINSISLFEERPERQWDYLPKPFFNKRESVFGGGWMQLYVRKLKGKFTPHACNPFTFMNYLMRGLNQ